MNQTVGVIGALGDLGSQLVTILDDQSIETIKCAYGLPDGPSMQEVINACGIVHICAPLKVLSELHSIPKSSIIVLHDSVMSSSREANDVYLHGQAAIVHMLMNDQQSVVIASDAPHAQIVSDHFQSIGLVPHMIRIDQHDKLMARSQAPLALLCQVLLPYLYEQHDAGLLTPSGQLLTETLRARQLAWTPETIRSILGNPQLSVLMEDMQAVIDKIGYNNSND